MATLHLVSYVPANQNDSTVGLLMDGVVVNLVAALQACPEGRPSDAWEQSVVGVLTCSETAQAVRETLDWLEGQAEAVRAELSAPRQEVKLLPPVQPNKLFCLAGNYMAHITESESKIGKAAAQAAPETPRIFMKPPSKTLRGDGEPIVLAKSSTFVDYEAEMAVIIGKEGRHIKAEDAMEYVAGITCFNDISERRLSIWPTAERGEWDRFFDWLNGKWMDSFAPMGPCVVPLSDIEDIHNLSLRLYLNDELMQEANTADMIFSVPRTIEYLSSILTIEPGDVIAMGTPSGVGAARGVQLQAGDVARVELAGVGVLSNPVVAE